MVLGFFRRNDASRDIAAIGEGLDALERLLGEPEARLNARTDVSGWSIAQHAWHIARVLESNLGTVRAIETRDEKRLVDSPRPGATALLILETGKIPRRRAKAPDSVVPTEQPDVTETRSRIAALRAELDSLRERPTPLSSLEGRVPHPILGAFTARQWIRFGRVHVDHHLAIANEVLESL